MKPERRTFFERTTDQLLNRVPRPAVFAKFENGRLLTGTRSTHRNPWAIRWNKMFTLKVRERLTR